MVPRLGRGSMGVLQLPLWCVVFGLWVAGWVECQIRWVHVPRLELGAVEARIHDERGAYVPFDSLPLALTMTLIASSDPTLRNRRSWVDVPVGILEAVHTNVMTGKMVVSGDTLSAWVSRGVHTPRARNGRWEEFVDMLRIEARYDDDAIVAIVANDIAGSRAGERGFPPLQQLELFEAAQRVASARWGSQLRRRPELTWGVLERLAQTPAEDLVHPGRLEEARAVQAEARRLLSGEQPVDRCL